MHNDDVDGGESIQTRHVEEGLAGTHHNHVSGSSG